MLRKMVQEWFKRPFEVSLGCRTLDQGFLSFEKLTNLKVSWWSRTLDDQEFLIVSKNQLFQEFLKVSWNTTYFKNSWSRKEWKNSLLKILFNYIFSSHFKVSYDTFNFFLASILTKQWPFEVYLFFTGFWKLAGFLGLFFLLSRKS